MLLHTLGRVPGSRVCVWGACVAQAGLQASAYRVITRERAGGAQSTGGPRPGNFSELART